MKNRLDSTFAKLNSRTNIEKDCGSVDDKESVTVRCSKKCHRFEPLPYTVYNKKYLKLSYPQHSFKHITPKKSFLYESEKSISYTEECGAPIGQIFQIWALRCTTRHLPLVHISLKSIKRVRLGSVRKKWV